MPLFPVLSCSISVAPIELRDAYGSSIANLSAIYVKFLTICESATLRPPDVPAGLLRNRATDPGGYAATVPDLVLLRHGQSTWNAENLFTGWDDVDLTAQGEAEATAGRARCWRPKPGLDLQVVHTSLLTRAIRTANLALDAAGRSWLPVRRHWRLNERHYGALQGKNKKETAEQFGDGPGEDLAAQLRHAAPAAAGRRPALPAADPRYRDVPAAALPATECLADVVRRIAPLLGGRHRPRPARPGARGGAVLVVAHGNSLRALRKHIDGIADDDIVDLEIPTGIPYRYRLADDLAVERPATWATPRPPGRPPKPSPARPADRRRAGPGHLAAPGPRRWRPFGAPSSPGPTADCGPRRSLATGRRCPVRRCEPARRSRRG